MRTTDRGIPRRILAAMARGAAVSFALVATAHAAAAEIRVVDDAGNPAADVMVVCLGGRTGAGLSGADGLVTLPDACKQIYCDRGDLVPDCATIVQGKAVCRVHTGVVVTVIVKSQDGPEGPSNASLHGPEDGTPCAGTSTIGDGVPRRHSGGSLRPASDGSLRFTTKPLMPGRYTLVIGQDVVLQSAPAPPGVRPRMVIPPFWSCERDLGELAAGNTDAAGMWRSSVELKGRVLDRAGKPVSDVPISLHPEPAPDAATANPWSCFMSGEVVTGSDGTFRTLIDPLTPTRIEAGWKNYPIGTASTVIRGAPPESLLLQLR